MIAALLPVLGPLVGDVVKRILPEDKDARMKVERELNMALMQNSAALEQAAASVIKAEAESEHKITATWRPVLMSRSRQSWDGTIFCAPGRARGAHVRGR